METMYGRSNKAANYKRNLFRLMEEHPELPVVPMVDSEVVAGDEYGRWIGKFGDAHISEYYIGEDRVFIRDDDDSGEVEELVTEICGYDVFEFMTDEEVKGTYSAVPWIRAIIVNIDLPDA